jgi:predicted nucleotidyltransferase
MGTTSSIVADVAREFGLRLVVRFGSTATGRASAGSDQDIAVLATHGLDLAEEARLVAELEGALGAPEVDLTVLNRADPLVWFQVACTGIPLYQAVPGAFLEMQSYASRTYDDTDRFRIAVRTWLEARLA